MSIFVDDSLTFLSLPSRTKENLLNEMTDLKHQIKKLEETNGDMSLGHKQLKREMNETRDQLDQSHKECVELKRLLKDAELEKETIRNNVDDLKEIIKNAEGMTSLLSQVNSKHERCFGIRASLHGLFVMANLITFGEGEFRTWFAPFKQGVLFTKFKIYSLNL